MSLTLIPAPCNANPTWNKPACLRVSVPASSTSLSHSGRLSPGNYNMALKALLTEFNHFFTFELNLHPTPKHPRCPICLQPTQRPYKLSCSYAYCTPCISHWISRSNECCPTRRRSIDRTTLTMLGELQELCFHPNCNEKKDITVVRFTSSSEYLRYFRGGSALLCVRDRLPRTLLQHSKASEISASYEEIQPRFQWRRLETCLGRRIAALRRASTSLAIVLSFWREVKMWNQMFEWNRVVGWQIGHPERFPDMSERSWRDACVRFGLAVGTAMHTVAVALSERRQSERPVRCDVCKAR